MSRKDKQLFAATPIHAILGNTFHAENGGAQKGKNNSSQLHAAHVRKWSVSISERPKKKEEK